MLGTKKRTPSLKSVETTQITVPTWDGIKSLAAPTVANAATWTSEQASHIAESAAPHIHKAAENARPAVRKAREEARKQAAKASEKALKTSEKALKASKKASKKASEQAPPQLVRAADLAKLAAVGVAARGAAHVGPQMHYAREVAQEKAPQLQAFVNEMVDAATSKEKRDLYASRAADAALVLKGEARIKRIRKGGLGKKLLIGLGIAALGTACAVVAQRVLAAQEDPWMRPEEDGSSTDEAPTSSYGSVYGAADDNDDLPLAAGSNGGRSASEYRNLGAENEGQPTYNDDLEVGTAEVSSTSFGESKRS